MGWTRFSAHFSWTVNSFQLSIVFQLRWCSSSCTKRTRRRCFPGPLSPTEHPGVVHGVTYGSSHVVSWAPPREMLFQGLWWHGLGACSLGLCYHYSVSSWLKKLNKRCPVPRCKIVLTGKLCTQISDGKASTPRTPDHHPGSSTGGPMLPDMGKVSYPRPRVNPLFPLILFYKNLPPCTTLWSPSLSVGLDAAWFLNHWVKACKISKFSAEHFLVRV